MSQFLPFQATVNCMDSKVPWEGAVPLIFKTKAQVIDLKSLWTRLSTTQEVVDPVVTLNLIHCFLYFQIWSLSFLSVTAPIAPYFFSSLNLLQLQKGQNYPEYRGTYQPFKVSALYAVVFCVLCLISFSFVVLFFFFSTEKGSRT